MMKDLTLGIRTYFASFSFLFKNKLAHYFLYPLVIVVLLTLLFANAIDNLVDFVSIWVYGLFDVTPAGDEDLWQTVKNWLANASKYTTMGVLYILLYYFYLKVNKYVVLILMSPIMALLSEKTEEVLTGNSYPFEWGQFLKDIWRGVLIALRNMFIEFGIIIGVWLLGLMLGLVFPPIMLIYTPLSAVFLFVVGAYFYGFSTMDYTNERRRLNVSQSVDFIRKHRGLAISNGAIFTFWLFIPILGPIIAPITCTAGVTLGIAERINLSDSDFALKRTPEAE